MALLDFLFGGGVDPNNPIQRLPNIGLAGVGGISGFAEGDPNVGAVGPMQQPNAPMMGLAMSQPSGAGVAMPDGAPGPMTMAGMPMPQGMADMPAPGAVPVNGATSGNLPNVAPVGDPRDIMPAGLASAMAVQPASAAMTPPGNMPMMPAEPGATPAKAAASGGGFFDALGKIYGAGGPGDTLMNLGFGLMSAPGNPGAGLLKGMALTTAQKTAAKKSKADELNQKLKAAQLQMAGRKWGVIAQDAYGNNKYGWINTTDQSVTPVNVPGVPAAADGGLDPKVARDIRTKQALEGNAGEKELDKKYAPELMKWQSGGQASARRNIDQLTFAEKRTQEGGTGPVVGILDKLGVNKYVNPKSEEAKQAVQTVVQQSLREILGGQFAQKEGEQLMARAFDPNLSTEENLRRIRSLKDTLAKMAQAKDDMAAYWQKNRTLRGYKGTIVDSGSVIREYENAIRSGGGTKATSENAKPPMEGARKAPNGDWVIQKNGKWFKVQQ